MDIERAKFLGEILSRSGNNSNNSTLVAVALGTPRSVRQGMVNFVHDVFCLMAVC